MSMWTSLEPTSLALDPGATATAVLRVRNDGDTVEEYQFAVVGAPAAWTKVDPASLRLYPGASGQAQLTFAPPRSAEALAGRTPYGVQVRARDNPAVFDVAEGAVDVTPFSEVRAELFPPTVRGRLSGRSGLTVRNLGNAPLTAAMSARDDENVLTFAPQPPAVQVSPGGTAYSRLRISPHGVRFGRGVTQHPYVATVSPSPVPGPRRGPERIDLRGTFIRRPLLSRLSLILLATVLVLGGVALGLYSFGVFRNGLPFRFGSVAAPQLPAAPPAATQPPSAPAAQPPPAQQNGQQGGQQNGGQGNGSDLRFTIAASGDGALLTGGTQDDRTAVAVLAPGGRGGDRSANLAAGQLWTAPAGSGQQVALVPVDAGQAVLEEGDGGKVFIRPVDNAADGGSLRDRQKWRLVRAGSGQGGNGQPTIVTIVNTATGDCLSDNGTGRPAVAVACQDRFQRQQRWILTTS